MSRRWSSSYGWFMLAFQTLVCVGIVAISIAQSSWIFAVFGCSLAFLSEYQNGFRIAVEVEISDDELRWRAPWRSGSVPLGAITTVRRAFASWDRWVIEVEGRRSISVWGRGDLRRWFDEWGLGSRAPWA